MAKWQILNTPQKLSQVLTLHKPGYFSNMGQSWDNGLIYKISSGHPLFPNCGGLDENVPP